MKKLQVLGTGCPRCEKLAEQAELAASELGMEYELEKVTDTDQISQMGVMITPALAVDGKVVVVGKVPPLDDLKSLIS